MEKLLKKKMAKNWIFIISIFFISCLNNQSKESLISRDDFKDILMDIHKMKSTNSISDSVSILDSVLVNYNTSYEFYKNTILFYSEDPSLMLDFLYEVQDSLSD